MNSEIFSRIFITKSNDSHEFAFWNEFLEASNGDVLWVPSGGNTLNDLIEKYFDDSPSVFIHTDYFPSSMVYKLLENKTVTLLHTTLRIKDVVELQLIDNSSFNFNYNCLPAELVFAFTIAMNDEHKLNEIKATYPEPEPVSSEMRSILRPKTFEEGNDFVKRGEDYKKIK